jgi:predicted transcriptional regulator
MKTDKKIQVYVTEETKAIVEKLAKDQDRSESFIINRIVEQALLPSSKFLTK